MSAFASVLIIWALLKGTHGHCETFHVEDEWPGGILSEECPTQTVHQMNEVRVMLEKKAGYQGILDVAVAQETHGWTLELNFDSAFQEFLCWSAEYEVGSDSRSVVVHNMDNGDLSAGSTLYLEFQVRYNDGGSAPQLDNAVFQGSNVVCGDNDGGGDGTTTEGVPPSGGRYDYFRALELSLLFYEAQRSGPLPADNRIDFRDDSAMGDFILGGYYDAGDHVKFGFPMASAATQLAWGAITFRDGYEAAGQTEYIAKCLRWFTDYFVAAHTAEFEFYAQVGDGYADHAYWGRPEDMTMDRPAYAITADAPGSELAAETAAALAASSMFYRALGDSDVADQALSHARELFNFANQHRGSYVDSIPNVADFYNSWNGYNDELAWGAAWMAKATGESEYLNLAEGFYDEFGLGAEVPQEFSWDSKHVGVQILLYDLTRSDKYGTAVNNFVDYLMDSSHLTPKGMFYIQEWGSLRHSSNVAHACAQIKALGVRGDDCDRFVEAQMNYILGDTGRSYLIGFGNGYPLRPHHRSSSCPDMPQSCDWPQFESPDPNPQLLRGALVGGPDQFDNYVDDRHEFQYTEVACDYNAGFQSAMASLAQKYS